MREFIIKENDKDQRVDKYLTKALPLLPKNLMYKYIRNKKIKVNKSRCDISQRLQIGDVVTMYIAEEFFETPILMDYLQCKLELSIVYEDEHIIVVYKPSGVSVHADEKYPIENLANAYLKYMVKSKQYDPQIEMSFTPAFVNRLDRNTEGLVIGAKNYHALKVLNEWIRENKIKKSYICLVEGIVKKKKDIVVLYHQKDEMNKKARVSQFEKDGYKEMKTKYEVLSILDTMSILDVELLSGRFHQIRATFAHLKHPLIGDVKYGAKKQRNEYQALCAYKIKFTEVDDQVLGYLQNKVIELEKDQFINSYVKDVI